MPIFLQVFSMSDFTYYRTYLSSRQTCPMPTKVLLIYKCFYVPASRQTPKDVGNVEIVENMGVDVTEPLLS